MRQKEVEEIERDRVARREEEKTKAGTDILLVCRETKRAAV